MTYHAIGKEKWQALPGLFHNSELANTLEEDTEWWCYSYMIPHKFRTDKNNEPLPCHMECWIGFCKRDHTFKKFLKPIPENGNEVGE